MLSTGLGILCRFVFDVAFAMGFTYMLVTLTRKFFKQWAELILLAYATICIVLTVKAMIKARKERAFYDNDELIEVDTLED